MLDRKLFLFLALSLAYVLPGLLPGRLLVPADLPRDSGAWKSSPAVRVRVSNSLLSDVPLQLIPWSAAARRHLARGEFPWKNELAGDAEELFANPLAGLLSPLAWPQLLGLSGWGWSVLLKMLVAALSMYWLATVTGIESRAAIVSAIVFALSGYTTVWALYPHTNVFVLLPALAAAGLTLSREPSARNVLLTGAIAALATAGGHPEGLFAGVVAIAIFVLAARERLVPFLAASLGGFLLIGVQLVPFAIVLSRSHIVLARTELLVPRFRKLSILSMILPGYLGSPLRGELDLTGFLPFAENFNQRNGAYVGALILLAIVIAFRRLPPIVRRGLVIGGVALVLSWCLPGVSSVVRVLPLMKWVAVEYFAVPFVLFAALAAGPAVFALLETPKARLGIALIACGVLLLMIGIAPAVAPSALLRVARAGIEHLQRSGHLHQPPAVYEERLVYYLAAAKWTALRRLALPAICWIAFGLALRLRRQAWLTAAVIAELIAFGWGYSPSIRVDEVAPEPPAIAAIERADPGHRWLIASSSDVFPANLATMYGVRDVHAYDILTSEARTRQLLPTGYDPFLFGLPAAPTDAQRNALAKLGVRYFVTWNGVRELSGAVPAPLPRNAPPDGLLGGIICSVLGAAWLLALALLSRGHGDRRAP